MSETRTCVCGKPIDVFVNGEMHHGCIEFDGPPYLPATPPTPDLAAVRTALVRVLEAAFLGRSKSPLDEPYLDLADAFGLHTPSPTELADALLAAVSRPAEARGEPVAWMMERDTPRAHSLRFTCDETEAQHESRSGYKVTPLYAAPRPEPGEVTDGVLTQRLGLHEVIEVRYYVDHYAAALLTADGDRLVAVGKDDSAEGALTQLRAALAAREGA